MYDVVDKVQLIGLYASAAAAIATIAITSRATRSKGILVPQNFPKDRCSHFRKYFDAFTQISAAAEAQKGPIATPATARECALNAFMASDATAQSSTLASALGREQSAVDSSQPPVKTPSKPAAKSLIKPKDKPATQPPNIPAEGGPNPPKPNLRPKPRK